MAVTSHVYPLAVEAINAGTIDLDTDTFKALLCTGDASAWTSTEEAFQFVDDITGAYTECADGDYARVTLTSPVLARSTNKITWKVTTPISWGSAVTITARSMAVFDSSIGGSVDSATPVICIVDFGVSVASTAGTWEYNCDATNGLAAWTSS
jgi:hypothetical protein